MPKAKKKRGVALRPKELATIKAQQELGSSVYAIAKSTGHSNGTVKKYLANAEAYSDPDMREMVEKIKAGEINDLVVLQTKARSRLHEVVARANPIEALAIMDRTFQQRRLLEGNSTANISMIAKIVQAAHVITKPNPEPGDPIDVSPVRKPVDVEEEMLGVAQRGSL